MGDSVVCVAVAFIWCLFSRQDALVSANDVITSHVTVGLAVTLSCSADVNDDAERLTWWSPANELLTVNLDRQTADDRFSVQQKYQRDRNLRIRSVLTDDAGVYECKLSQDHILASVRLIVNVPPSVVSISDDVRKHVGSDIILRCSTSGTPQPLVTWYKVYADEEKEVSEGGSLSLTSITRHDAGIYSCHADNGVPPAASKRVRLDVLFGPEFALPYRQMVQSVGTDALLTCLVHAFPAGELHWVHADRSDARLPILGNRKYRVQNWTMDDYSILYGLHISSITWSDYGTYFCSAHNDFGTDKAQIFINALNGSGASTMPLVDCKSSTNYVLIGVIVVIAMLLAVAMVALAVALYEIRSLKRNAPSSTYDELDTSAKTPAPDNVDKPEQRGTSTASSGRSSHKATAENQQTKL